ncbi:ABC transporter permease [Urbifossiella limnaea]|uniref:Transport permease protein n=1 Tax=Urbifossiella limnaea TaxID=2528023 RepID=A0A517XVN3_9BACT|nr:ABC transporter permease [Urbifossiella limnaea]QDU21556.1 ABC-2 type transporter [Urbifossiella limnaea]
MSPLWQLTLARLREFFRRPAAVFWVYGFPLGMALILGAAFRDRPPDKVRVDVRTDGPAGATAADALAAVLRTDHIDVTTGDEAATRARLRTAKTDLVVTPAATPAAAAEYFLEPNRPEAAQARTLVDRELLLRRVPGYQAPAEAKLTEPGGRYIDFLIPGLLGINLMGGGLWGVGFVVVDMRVRKLLKRFLATPMRRTDFLLALIFSRLIFTLIEIVLLLTFSYVVFDVRVRGDLTAFAGLVLLGGAAFAGVGLLVASRAETVETVSGLMNAVMLPMYLFSGVFFSSDRFPEAMQPVIRLLPLTALNDGLRAVMNDGAGWAAAAGPAAILAAWGVVCYALAFRLFRWR